MSTVQQIQTQNAIFEQARASGQITQAQYNSAMIIQNQQLAQAQAREQPATLPADFVGPRQAPTQPKPPTVTTPMPSEYWSSPTGTPEGYTQITNKEDQTKLDTLNQIAKENKVFIDAQKTGKISSAEYNTAIHSQYERARTIEPNIPEGMIVSQVQTGSGNVMFEPLMIANNVPSSGGFFGSLQGYMKDGRFITQIGVGMKDEPYYEIPIKDGPRGLSYAENRAIAGMALVTSVAMPFGVGSIARGAVVVGGGAIATGGAEAYKYGTTGQHLTPEEAIGAFSLGELGGLGILKGTSGIKIDTTNLGNRFLNRVAPDWKVPTKVSGGSSGIPRGTNVVDVTNYPTENFGMPKGLPTTNNPIALYTKPQRVALPNFAKTPNTINTNIIEPTYNFNFKNVNSWGFERTPTTRNYVPMTQPSMQPEFNIGTTRKTIYADPDPYPDARRLLNSWGYKRNTGLASTTPTGKLDITGRPLGETDLSLLDPHTLERMQWQSKVTPATKVQTGISVLNSFEIADTNIKSTTDLELYPQSFPNPFTNTNPFPDSFTKPYPNTDPFPQPSTNPYPDPYTKPDTKTNTKPLPWNLRSNAGTGAFDKTSFASSSKYKKHLWEFPIMEPKAMVKFNPFTTTKIGTTKQTKEIGLANKDFKKLGTAFRATKGKAGIAEYKIASKAIRFYPATKRKR